MDAAENTALSDDGEPVDHDYQYYNAKEMIEIPQFGTLTTEPPIELNEIEAAKPKPVPQKEIILTDSKKFGVPVNTTLSSVIPYTNVYDRGIKNNQFFNRKYVPYTHFCFHFSSSRSNPINKMVRSSQ